MVIQITPAYKPSFIYGGPTISVSTLCEELAKTKLDIIVLTTTANGDNRSELKAKTAAKVDGVTVNYFKREIKGQIHLSFQLLVCLYKLLKSDLAIVHIHSWWNATSILSCMIAKILNRKVILSPRGMLTQYSFNNRHRVLKQFIHSLIGERLIRYCVIHATTEMEKSDIMKMINHENIVVIPNYLHLTIPLKKELNKKSNSGEYFRLLYLSRIEQKKGLDLLFAALKELDFKWRLTIAGSGTEKYILQLKNKATAYNIDGHIEWVGFIDQMTKSNLLVGHDLLVLFSENENFANVVIESLLHGLPVAISSKIGLSDFVLANDLGWVTELNCKSLVSTLEDAQINIPKRQAISEKAGEVVKARFHVTKVLPKYISLYTTK